jgi:hypothetical protein
MDNFTMFVPLAKADAAQRLVYGYFDETPDRAGEVCDYASAKPAFQSWSAELAKVSEGKNLGNIRGQHNPQIAAGKLVEITFDDDLKKIGFVAKIVDDNEWRKVEEGVHTGFSPGGKYAKKWQDGGYVRYTPIVRELSIVDVPCNPSSTFTMVKSDGVEEEIQFVMAKAYEPGNEATKARADVMAKAAGGDAKPKDYVAQARAELIAENAAEALTKAHEDNSDTKPASEPADALSAALAKAAAAMAATPKSTEVSPLDDLLKAHAALMALRARVEPEMAKGLYTVGSLARLIEEFTYIQQSCTYETQGEGDNSTVPAQLAQNVAAMCATLRAMVIEETAEIVAAYTAQGMDIDFDPAEGEDDDDVVAMELAAQIVDLVKADADVMAKAGARHSKKDAESIQSMHDTSVTLGATCASDVADKAEALAAENERLSKAHADAIPAIEEMTKALQSQNEALAKANARIAELEALPLPPKGAVAAISREDDARSAGGEGGIKTTTRIEHHLQKAAETYGAERQRHEDEAAILLAHSL